MDDLIDISVDDLQRDFDAYLDRVEIGEIFRITTDAGSVVLISSSRYDELITEISAPR